MMAAVPVSPSIVRLIQRNLLPQAGTVHLAEVFLSGLLRRVAPAENEPQRLQPRYEFWDGVRQRLLRVVLIPDTERVMDQVADDVLKRLPDEVRQQLSEDIERRLGRSMRSFEAFLLPELLEDLAIDEKAKAEVLPFAAVTREVLQGLGGKYADWVEELTQSRIPNSAESENRPLDEAALYDALNAQIDYFQREILDYFVRQNYQFEAVFPGLRPKELSIQPMPEEICLAEGEELSLTIVERRLVEVLEDHASFELEVRINFAVELSYFDADEYHPEFNESPTIEEIIPDQTINAVAEVALLFSEDDHSEIEPELIDLRVEQPILIDLRDGATSHTTPPLLEFEFETGVIDETLQPFEFTVATIEVQTRRLRNPKLVVHQEQRQAWQFVEALGEVELEMVSIPGGSFLMGSPEDESDRSNSESPQHSVTVDSFFIGKHPITQAQWRIVAEFEQVNRSLDPDPSEFKGDARPVENVSWHDAVEFCDRLSRLTGKSYRLPTEAEWEYACRASPAFLTEISGVGDAVGNGDDTPFHFGETITPELANYDCNSVYSQGVKGQYREETTPVGNFGLSNHFGLYDMHGNVREWCADYWHDTYNGAPTNSEPWCESDSLERITRVLRGGSWQDLPQNCRSASRYALSAELRSDSNGFRVVCSVGIEDSNSQRVGVEALCRSLSDKYARGELQGIEQVVSDVLKSHLENLNLNPEPESSYSYEAELVEISVLQGVFKVLEPPNQVFRPGDSDADGVVIEAELIAEVDLECNFSFTTYDSIDREDIVIGVNDTTIQASLEANVLISLMDESTSAEDELEVGEIELEVTNLDEIDWGFIEPDWGDPNDDYDWNEEHNDSSAEDEPETSDDVIHSDETNIDEDSPF
ncbi:SUMF1/EgtB/PvdO family nonheme iron enzyme [Cyanobacteria bacterium FACHB-63]|nr:SUMF1/EgtB/PvdO family nonheme iron enzyme [Cyanobacteria bacterium FACHB-63]